MKRIFVLWSLIITLICTAVSPAATVFASEPQGESGIEMDFLTSMGFFDANESSSLNRGEMAKILCKVMGITPYSIDKTDVICRDVTGKTEYAAEIMTAIDAGMMKADADGKFWPESAVTFSDACLAFSIVAGGAMLLEHMDAESAAIRLGILDGRSYSKNMTREQVAGFLYSTLHSSYFEAISFGDGVEYAHNRHCLVLEARCNIVYDYGIVEGISGTKLEKPDRSIKDGKIMIDGVLYEGIDADEFFGYSVDYYYSKPATDDTSEVRELLYIAERPGVNNVLVLDGDDIISVANMAIKYYADEDGDKVKSEKIPIGSDIIYNGVSHQTWTDSDLMPDYGSVTLIDNDNDDEIDVIFVESYTFMVVGIVNSTDEIIYDAYNGTSLDLKQDNLVYEVYKNDGSKTTLSRAVRLGKLIGVLQSKNTTGDTKIKINVFDGAVTGKITLMNDQSIVVGATTAYIPDAIYNSGEMSSLRFGDTVSIYLWNGMIVRIDGDSSNAKTDDVYYLMNAALEQTKDGERLQFMLAVSGNTSMIANGAEKITADGVNYKNHSKLYEMLKDSAMLSYYDSNYPLSQPIQVWFNDEGEINKIDTLHFNSTKEDKKDTLVSEFNTTTMYYVLENRTFYKDETMQFTVSPDAKTFWVPSNCRYDEEFYGLVAGGGFSYTGYVVEPFFVDEESFVADAVFCYYTPIKTAPATSAPGILTDVLQIYNEETGETETWLELFNAGSMTIRLPLHESVNASNLAIGDVLQWRLNYAGEVTAISVCFSPAAGVPIKNQRINAIHTGSTTDRGQQQIGTRVVFGTLMNNNDGVLTVTTSVKTDEQGVLAKENLDNYLINSANTKYFRYYKDPGKGDAVRVWDLNKMQSYALSGDDADEVVLFIREGVLTFAYVIK